MNNEKNKEYQTILKNAFSGKLNLIVNEDFETGCKEILKIKFKFIYLIISGRNFTDYVEFIDSKKNELKNIPITIIFTKDSFRECLNIKKKKKKTQMLN